MPIKLSVCIPTHNRAAFIGKTIESVISQATDEVEIVISDNASTDCTEEIVRAYQKQFPRITYLISDQNEGADRNLLKVIGLAKGDYCWIMGSDDIIEPNGLSHVLSQLIKYKGLTGISVNLATYSIDMNTELNAVPIAGGNLKEDRLFTNAETCFSLLGVYFGYFSGQIVNRSLWNMVVATHKPYLYCNGFVIVYVIGNMIKKTPNWLYIHSKCVGNRTGNDSILKEVGTYNRQVIAHAVFENVVRNIFPEKRKVYNNVMYMALTSYMRFDIVYFKLNGAAIEFLIKLFILYARIYWRFSYFWLVIFPLFLAPKSILTLIRYLYRVAINTNKAPNSFANNIKNL
jgi:abequosyltransferase